MEQHSEQIIYSVESDLCRMFWNLAFFWPSHSQIDPIWKSSFLSWTQLLYKSWMVATDLTSVCLGFFCTNVQYINYLKIMTVL